MCSFSLAMDRTSVLKDPGEPCTFAIVTRPTCFSVGMLSMAALTDIALKSAREISAPSALQLHITPRRAKSLRCTLVRLLVLLIRKLPSGKSTRYHASQPLVFSRISWGIDVGGLNSYHFFTMSHSLYVPSTNNVLDAVSNQVFLRHLRS
jgi:hypothetical protein